MTAESKLQLVILDAKPHVIDTTVVYGFNRVKSNCYWAFAWRSRSLCWRNRLPYKNLKFL